MYWVTDGISLTKLDNTTFDVPSVEESKRSRKDLKHFLTPIKSSAHVQTIPNAIQAFLCDIQIWESNI